MAATDLEDTDLEGADLATPELATADLSLEAGVFGEGAVEGLALFVTLAFAALADPPAAAEVFDGTFNGAAGAFEAGFVVADDLDVEPCERADEAFAPDLAEFASFFEDAILIAP